MSEVVYNQLTLSIEKEEATRFSGERCTVYVFLPDSSRTASVSVFGPSHRFGTVQPAQVNWSALGSTSAADAVAYATAIEYASLQAAELRGPVHA